MNQPQFDDPDGESAARLAQLVAMSATVVEALAKLQAHRAAQRADEDERVTTAWRAQRTADHAAARVAWSPAHDDEWLRRASTGDLAPAWTAAATWSSTDADAADALNRIEARLHQLHPGAMAAYQEARARGADPGQAMHEASQRFTEQLALPGQPAPGVEPGHSPSRPPRVIASDAYPYLTRDGVAAAARGQVHVITGAREHTNRSPSRAAARH